MGTKIQDLFNKRATLQKGSDIQSLAKVIIQGIKKANVYATLNKPNVSATDLLDSAIPDYQQEFSKRHVRCLPTLPLLYIRGNTFGAPIPSIIYHVGKGCRFSRTFV
jgi:hypothetical protein